MTVVCRGHPSIRRLCNIINRMRYYRCMVNLSHRRVYIVWGNQVCSYCSYRTNWNRWHQWRLIINTRLYNINWCLNYLLEGSLYLNNFCWFRVTTLNLVVKLFNFSYFLLNNLSKFTTFLC